jgi:uncharacterized protein
MASFPIVNKAPGVYIQEVTVPGPIAGVSTSIAAFVGPAQMGPLLTPTMLTNVNQFWQIFGTYIETPYRVYAAHAVNGFFNEGGEQCYFVRVGNGKPASALLFDSANLPSAVIPQQVTMTVTAQQEGTAGNSITAQVMSASIATATAANPSATPAGTTSQIPYASPVSTGTGNMSITVASAATAGEFLAGDQVNINDGTHSENATVASVSGAVINFAAALANTYSSGAIVKRDRITVTSATDAAGFAPGDVVTIAATGGTPTESATIASISVVMVSGTKVATIILQGPLTNTYSNGSIVLANLTPGTTTIRVTDAAGLQSGSYVTISNTTNTEYNVVRLVNSVSNVLTLTNPLANSYPMGSGAAALKVTSMEFTLKIVAPTATETFPNLAMDPRHSRYYANLVNSAFINLALASPPSTTPPPLNIPAVQGPTGLSGGLNDNLKGFTTANYTAGIDALKQCGDVNLVCVPDAVTTTPSGNSQFQVADTHAIQTYMVAHCELMQDRFAILDASQLTPFDFTYNAVQSQRQGLNSDNGYAALYFPWIAITSPFGSGQIFVPPSGHIAGVYSTNDNNFGVFKAPGNEPIVSALALDTNLSDDVQGPINWQGINVIRSFPDQGILIWGARTITPPQQVPWRYINVRRLLLYIEGSIQEGTRFAVFEPNNITLWGQVKRIVSDFLMTQWQEGALFGDTPDQAFAVVVDETNNPPNLRAQGELIVQVTVVPTTPAEFIVFQVIQDITGATLQESTS